jgi:hypothetical protein
MRDRGTKILQNKPFFSHILQLIFIFVILFLAGGEFTWMLVNNGRQRSRRCSRLVRKHPFPSRITMRTAGLKWRNSRGPRLLPCCIPHLCSLVFVYGEWIENGFGRELFELLFTFVLAVSLLKLHLQISLMNGLSWNWLHKGNTKDAMDPCVF